VGYARQKAENWWMRRERKSMPSGTQEALEWLEFYDIEEPVRIATRKNGKYTEVKEYEFNRTERNQETSGQPGQTNKFDTSKLPTVQQLRDRHV
jgi:hypothetical protein